jgi:hypothetical protein
MKYQSEYFKQIRKYQREDQKAERKEREELGPELYAATKAWERKFTLENRRRRKLEWVVALSEHPPVTIKIPDPGEPRPPKWHYTSDRYRDLVATLHWPNGNRCQRCGLYAGYLHHTTYRNINTPLEKGDLVRLCSFCHRDVHEHGSVSKNHGFTPEELAQEKVRQAQEKVRLAQEQAQQAADCERRKRENAIVYSIILVCGGIMILSFFFGWDRIAYGTQPTWLRLLFGRNCSSQPNWLGWTGISIILAAVVSFVIAVIRANLPRPGEGDK